MVKLFLIAAAIGGGSAVAFGAFGAHALKSRLEANLLSAWETAVDYQFWHVLALLGVALILHTMPAQRSLLFAGWGFIVGTSLFSGSLYILAATELRSLGPVSIGLLTPLGGVILLSAWIALLVYAIGLPAAR